MPQEKKKRGRREQQKRKREVLSTESVSKKQRLDSTTVTEQIPENDPETFALEGASTYDPTADFVELGPDRANRRTDIPFFGLLDEEEQAYYANANSKLELDDFESTEDRALFVDAVYQESEGKELKIACSQSCSRYLERLMLVSSSIQLKSLWTKFQGHFLNLVQHRFASHCCETLFLKSAPRISQEMRSPDDSGDNGREFPSMEQLFLEAAAELEVDLGYLLTERFASHTIRVLFFALLGEPLETTNTKSIIASRKKESIDVSNKAGAAGAAELEQRTVPKSFRRCFYRLKERATSSLTTTHLRALATHPTGNPVLQLLIRIEGAEYRKTKSKDNDVILHRLFPEEKFEEDSDNSRFVLGLLYDPTGSRLLEALVQSTPGHVFKKLFSKLLKPKLASMVKHDSASYVAIRILERIGRENLQDAINDIVPELPTLVARGRLDIIRVLVERCILRNLDPRPLASSIRSAFGNDHTSTLLNMLHFDAENSTNLARLVDANSDLKSNKSKASPINPHGALLAQAMIRSRGFATIIQAGILATSVPLLILFAKDPTASRVLQAALTANEMPLEFRRQLIPRFYGRVADLSIDASGSHVVDCLWPASSELYYMKEHVAQELSKNETTLRESMFGRVVWRNWKMDQYRRRKGQWIAEAKNLSRDETNDPRMENVKASRIELARKRFLAKHTR